MSWHQTALLIGRLIIVSEQAYHCCVISKLNDGVGVVLGRAVMSEQGVQEGTEHAPLRGYRVEDCVADVLLPTLTTWGAARQEVQDPVAEGGVCVMSDEL